MENTAEGNHDLSETNSPINRTIEEKLECPICLQACIHPVRLPCGHIFCFLCVKGVANKNKKCAMCRSDIPIEFINHPTLVNEIKNDGVVSSLYQWFYEGRNGWWQYDERTSQELEVAFNNEEKDCLILVAGYVYYIDFQKMYQIRQNDISRQRKIKRDLANIPKKGVAGLTVLGSTENSSPTTNDTSTSLDVIIDSVETLYINESDSQEAPIDLTGEESS